jgi:hypothetical protein
VILSTWSGERPEKQNMPIWSVMCFQLRFDPYTSGSHPKLTNHNYTYTCTQNDAHTRTSLARLATSFWRIVMIRSAMPFTS